VDVSVDNGGTVRRTDGNTLTTYPSVLEIHKGEYVGLEAMAAPGYTFSGWSGAVTGDANPIYFYYNFDGAMAITAHFTPQALQSFISLTWRVSRPGILPAICGRRRFV